MNWVNSRELRTWCLDNEHVGEVIKDTMGLSGISCLWIFGGHKGGVCGQLSNVVGYDVRM